MAFIEWFFLVWFVISVVGGIYFYRQGGFHKSLGDRIFSFIINVGLLTWLALSGPLTWFGVALVFIYIYNMIVIPVKAFTNPDGSWTGRGWIAFDTILAVACIFLILTVGVVV